MSASSPPRSADAPRPALGPPPAGMRPRPAARDDVDALVALLVRWDVAETGAPDTTADDVTSEWDRPGMDPRTDTVVLVAADGGLVGYAFVAAGDAASTLVEADTVADPALGPDRAAVQEWLLQWVGQRTTDLAAASGRARRVQHWARLGSARYPALLAAGWRHGHTLHHLARPLTGPLPEPVWPPGVRLRPFVRERDAESVWRLVQTAFAEIPGQPQRSLPDWVVSNLDRSDFVPELLLTAVVSGPEHDGALVGAAVTFDWEDRGWVRQLAVDRSQRGRGVGLALLQQCFLVHRDRGLPKTGLGVDTANDTGAQVLYARAGLRLERQFARFETSYGSSLVDRPARGARR